MLESLPSSHPLPSVETFNIKSAAGPQGPSERPEEAAVEFSALNGSPVSPPPSSENITEEEAEWKS